MCDTSYMKIIVGLGNPGKKYAQTRHNAGFLFLDFLAKEWKTGEWKENKTFQALVAETEKGKRKILLVKPQTSMNNSGRSIGPLARFYKLEPKNVLLIYDDIDLPPNRVRFRRGGSSAGHNGVESVEGALGSFEMPRIRFGIGRDERWEPEEYVLKNFTQSELTALKHRFPEALKLLEEKFLGR